MVRAADHPVVELICLVVAVVVLTLPKLFVLVILQQVWRLPLVLVVLVLLVIVDVLLALHLCLEGTLALLAEAAVQIGVFLEVQVGMARVPWRDHLLILVTEVLTALVLHHKMEVML